MEGTKNKISSFTSGHRRKNTAAISDERIRAIRLDYGMLAFLRKGKFARIHYEIRIFEKNGRRRTRKCLMCCTAKNGNLQASTYMKVSLGSTFAEFNQLFRMLRIPQVETCQKSLTPSESLQVTGMLLPNPSWLSLLFWQWLNQTHNALVNYSNRNATQVSLL